MNKQVQVFCNGSFVVWSEAKELCSLYKSDWEKWTYEKLLYNEVVSEI